MLESVEDSRYHKLALFLTPWYAATRIGSSIEDRYNQKVAGLPARWCEVNDGLIGGRDEN
jgi:hypothetical protein